MLPGEEELPGDMVLPGEMVLDGDMALRGEEELPGEEGSPGEAAEGLGQRVEAVSLHDEDLKLGQGLNVLRQVLQAVTGQVEEYLQGGRM